MRKLLILFLLITITNLFSLNITLKNGETLKGKLVLLKRNCYYIFADQTLMMIDNNIVEGIDFDYKDEVTMVFRPSRQNINLISFPIVIKYDINSINGRILPANDKRQFHRPNLKLLPLSFGFGIIGYVSFKEYNEINKQIKDLKDNNLDIPKELVNKKGRKQFLGFTCIGVSILNTFIAIGKVEIYSDIDYIGVSYKF